MYFQEKRANQVICTGISQIILGCCVFALSFVLGTWIHSPRGSVFEIGVAYWGGVPTVIAGILGMTGGLTGRFMVTSLFLAASAISCILGGIVSTCVGITLTSWRRVGECKHVHCPYDKESILMICLISISILQAALSLSGVIESSQLLCCAVSDRDHVSILLAEKSSHAEENKRLRSERANRKRPLKNNTFFSADYSAKLDSFPSVEFGFKKDRQGCQTIELSTIV